MNDHSCVKIDIRPTDYVMGDGRLTGLPILPSGNWLPYTEFYERQKINFETDGCVLFTAQESFDAQMEYLIENNQVPQFVMDFLNSNGYMDTGLDGKKHFHSSPRYLQILTGNGYNGNNLYDPWDVMRTHGVLPWTDLPYDSNTTQAEYLSGITSTMTTKAMTFLNLIGGKNAIQYHWVTQGAPGITKMILSLQTAPLCVGVNIGTDWNEVSPPPPADGTNPGHAVMNYYTFSNEVDVYDHYLPNPKRLINYPVWYALQGVVSIIPIPPPPTPSPEPTNQTTVTWLSAVAAWLQAILERISPQGRAKLGGASRSTKWPEFKKEFAKTHLPVCAACGGVDELNLHHLYVFHAYPEYELAEWNVRWLCNKNRCHIDIGHLGDFKSVNPNGAEDIKVWRDKRRMRPETVDEIKKVMPPPPIQ